MTRGLVVVEPTDRGRELIELADDIAAGTNMTLELVRAIDEDEYGQNLQRKARGSIDDVGSIEELKERARAETDELGRSVLSDEVSYSTRVLFGDVPGDLLEMAAERDVDHIFIAGEKRSPAGKVLFGDTTQSVLLNFDGPVTSLIR